MPQGDDMIAVAFTKLSPMPAVNTMDTNGEHRGVHLCVILFIYVDHLTESCFSSFTMS
jgi:hypothetical protein